jgi:hypothetical protein
MAVAPTLVSVTLFAGLVVPVATVPKFRLVGKRFAVVPVPPSAACCGLPAALSVTLRAAERAPLAVGLNVTLMMQLDPAASELPQVWVWAKSPGLFPLTAMLVIVKEVVPTFVSVTFIAALVVPIAWVKKLRLTGESFAVVPIPLTVTCWGLPTALSVTRSAAVRVPDPAGLKVKLIKQLAPAASELPQLWVWEKSPVLVPAKFAIRGIQEGGANVRSPDQRPHE